VSTAKFISKFFDVPAGAFMLIAAIFISIVSHFPIVAASNWWADELFSLWASDVSLPFSQAFRERIHPDSHPPLYYSLLYWARMVAWDDPSAIATINVIGILFAAGTALWISMRSDLLGLACAGIAAFLLSGPTQLFASEARGYSLALSITFLASWYVAVLIQDPLRRPNNMALAGVGVVAALVHVYTALFAGSLAAGMLALTLFKGRKNLFWPGLVLGVSTSMVFLAWFSSVAGALTSILWIEFSLRSIYQAVSYVVHVSAGGWLNAMLLAALLMFGVGIKATRQLFLAFGTAFLVFALFPVVVSFHTPIVYGRYWLVGTPALIVVVFFAMRAWVLDALKWPDRRSPAMAALGALVFVCGSTASGFAAGYGIASGKKGWAGAKVVRPLIHSCPDHSIHVASVAIGPFRTFTWGFARMSSAPLALFVDSALESTPPLVAATSPCSVLGWGEHMPGELMKGTDVDILRFMKIAAMTTEVEILRHGQGFVILKRTR
jgi:hypothetical protein